MGELMEDAALRRFAADEQRLHDPAQQTNGWPGRCALCSYTRWPCSTWELATAVLELMGERDDRGEG